jgi:hypothetical protein
MSAVRFGTVRAYDVVTGTATVEIDGYAGSWLVGIAVADDVLPAHVVDGARCVLAFNGDGYNVADACLVATF